MTRILFDLRAWQVLSLLAERGGLSAAASELELEPSTAGRLLTGLEKALGRELVVRGRRPLVLSEDGRRALRGVRPILRAQQAFLDRLRDEASDITGLIRLSVAGGMLNSNKLMPMLSHFRELYPGVDFDLSAGLSTDACLSGDIDVAGVSGGAEDPRLVRLPRGRSVFIPVATPAYLARHGEPRRPEDLARHSVFVYNGPVRVPTTQLFRRGETRPISFGSRVQSTDIIMIKKAVLDGLGVAVDLPLLHCADELASGELKVILSGWHRRSIPAWAICTRGAWRKRLIRTFMAWWSERFRHIFAATESVAWQVLGEATREYLDEPEAEPPKPGAGPVR